MTRAFVIRKNAKKQQIYEKSAASYFYTSAKNFCFRSIISSIREMIGCHILDVLATLDAVRAILVGFRPDTLRGGAGSQCQDGLLLLHDQDVVDAFFSRAGVAHVLQVAGHVFLAVEIVREIDRNSMQAFSVISMISILLMKDISLY